MIVWKYTLREMRYHPGRALLTLLSVVIGVAAVIAVGLSTGAARRAYHEMFQAVSGRTALEVRAAGGGGMDQKLLATVEQTAVVRAAAPLIARMAILYSGDERVKVLALGIDPGRDAAVRDLEVVEGKMFDRGDAVVLDSAFAQGLNVAVGDMLKLLTRRGLQEMQVAGLVSSTSGGAAGRGGMLFMPITTAQYSFAARGHIDQIQVVLDEDADVETARAELAGQLPPGIEVRPPVTSSPLADETMLALENGLRMAIAFSLVAAVFIIMNTFLMNVGQRRMQLAILRAIGATRRQVTGLLYREALLMAVAGTILGIVAGLAAAKGLAATMSVLMQTPMPRLEFTPLPFVLAVAFGLGISFVGAALPARRAARVTPLEGMQGVAEEDVEGGSRWTVAAGFIVLLVTAILFGACLAGWIPVASSVMTMVAALIGLVLLLPLLLRPLTYVGQLVLRPVVKVEARLARRQLLRHRGRTTLTVGVLFVAVGTGVGLASSVVDNVQDVRTWYRSALVGDFFIRAMMPDMQTGLSAALPEGIGEEISKIAGVAQVDTLRVVSGRAADEAVLVICPGNVFSRDGAQGDLIEMANLPEGDGVVIGSVLAQRTGLTEGDQITLETKTGPQPLRIESVANSYFAGGLTITMRRELGQRLLGLEGVDAYIIAAVPEMRDQAKTGLRSLAEKHGLLLQSYADLTAIIEGMMRGVVASLWGLLVLGLVVAAFGVVNTLGMNVLEQTRELSMLRVVAMTRRQVRRAILSQAAMLAIIGVVPGLVAGVMMAYLINLSTLPVIGHPVAFSIHPWLLLACLIVSFAIVLAAAWLPAQRAARLELAAALRYE